MSVGCLGSPFGVQGFLHIHSHSGETAHLFDLGDVTLARGTERKAARIVKVIHAPGGAAVLLEDSTGPEDAREWTGWEVLVPRSKAAPLHADEYYIADLVGCALLYRGERVGEVQSVLEGGSVPLLEIRKDAGKAVLVPFRSEFVGAVDMVARTIELLVDWILE